MRIKFSKADLSTDQPLVLMISDGGKLLSSAQTLDKKTNQLINEFSAHSLKDVFKYFTIEKNNWKIKICATKGTDRNKDGSKK